jgi:hypothetical protein
MFESSFSWLSRWYSDRRDLVRDKCIEIENLDNPGWSLKIKLENTELKDKIFEEVEIERDDNNWIHGRVRDYKFEGACGPLNLVETLDIFKKWTEDYKPFGSVDLNGEDGFSWLSDWFFKQCDGDWEHDLIVRIKTLDNHGWSIDINLEYTELEDKIFESIEIKRDINNWICCRVERKKFEGKCGPLNLVEVLNIFKAWAIDS